MDFLSTFNLKRWVAENQSYFNPPFRTNKLLVHHKDFLVMVLRGPNTRLDFHIEPGDEFFYQVEGDMELHLKPEGEGRQVVQIKEGEIFVCPGGLPHSPRRFDNTWGLVIERKRRLGEKEEFAWFCEKCDELVLSRIMDRIISLPRFRRSIKSSTTMNNSAPAGPAVMCFRRRRWLSGWASWRRKSRIHAQ